MESHLRPCRLGAMGIALTCLSRSPIELNEPGRLSEFWNPFDEGSSFIAD